MSTSNPSGGNSSRGPFSGVAVEQSLEGSASTLPIGFTLAEFTIERVIGEGGFGIVYLALDMQLQRKVAIKEYMPTSLAVRRSDLSVTVTSPRHRETFDLGLRSFVKEAITLARFDHPALLKVFRFWEERGTAYMVMPFLEGQTLKQHLRAKGSPPSEEWLRQLLEPLLDGLEHLHANNCLHRDIAPDNIQLLPSGAPLLLDFGAARQVIGDATQALTVILKPGFAPIEQYAESPTMKQGSWTDIYALAAVVYFAISGKAPRPSVSRVLNDDMQPAAEVGAGRYSPQFLAFVDACLSVRVADRPQNVAQARRLLFESRTVAPLPLEAVPNDDQRTILRAPPPPLVAQARVNRVAEGVLPPKEVSIAPRRRAGPIAALGALVLVVACGLAWRSWPVKGPAASLKPKDVVASDPSPSPAVAPALTPPGRVIAADAPKAAAVPTLAQAAPALERLTPPLMAQAALEQILTGRSAEIDVSVKPSRSTVTRRRDVLSFAISSNVDGYAYVYATGSDDRQLGLLFPNLQDRNNRIGKGASLELPRPSWRRATDGPSGRRSIMVVVSKSPRDLRAAGWKLDSVNPVITLRPEVSATAAPSAARAWPPQAAVLGLPNCAAGAACEAAYGAAGFDVTVFEPPGEVAAVLPPVKPRAQREADAPPASAKTTKTTASDGSRADTQQECARLLQQASLGQDTPDLTRRLTALRCQ